MKKLFSIAVLVVLVVLLISSCDRDTNYVYIGQKEDTGDVTPQGETVVADVADGTEIVNQTTS